MSLLYMAWRNLINRRIQTLITVIVVSVGIAMTLSILLLSGGIKQGIVKASEPFGMIVGSKGSANQLVFNTIFMMDNPLANISLGYYQSLEQDPRVTLAVPFALGDNYKGFRIVGTSPRFFTLKGTPVDPPYFQLASGRIFEKPFEAVIGAKVAKETGLRVGDTFISGHGVARSLEEDHTHDQNPYTVVGILRRVSAPSDQGVYVSMDSYWVSHEHGDHHEGSPSGNSVPTGNGKPAADGHDGDDHDEALGVTAALIKPKSYIDLMKLYQEINQTKDAQAVFPGQVIAKLFDMIGSGEAVLKYISYVVLGMAGLTIVLALYGSTLERRRTVSILRALGAGRNSVLSIVMLESLLVVSLGCIGGIALGAVLSGALSYYIGAQSSITVAYTYDWSLLTVIAAVGLLGLAAGIVPALGAYRTETARYLNLN
ncbi:ABC transporter permease [Paenibacillus filicis]|uniref:Putative hemin transport system permease protein HrtB n=1 Tax=Paenibacillus gyeongsangnamensis TaxID=3388067 RepID=A0ABT4Q747_9BACL|nr:ABC transporter permease [Paenibacillus filicis]MCZ8512697.1 ABC transporter permease [Paenibacillus filicis]